LFLDNNVLFIPYLGTHHFRIGILRFYMVSADRFEKERYSTFVSVQRSFTSFEMTNYEKLFKTAWVKLNLGMWMQGARCRNNRSNLVGCEDYDKPCNAADASLNSISLRNSI